MTQAQKGTFLQLPSVFIETCDLSETAQIMYIRMLHNFGYKGVYTGSLRKLANLVRMPKSTVDRMLTKLCNAHLISRGNTEASETEHSILQVSLDPEYLWNANIDYCTTHTVPNWDSSKKEEMSQDETKCPNLGRAVPVAGQSVPTHALKQATNITKTNKTTIDNSHVASVSTESDGAATLLSSLSMFEETLEEVQNGSTNTDVAHLVHPDDDPLYSSSNHRSTPQPQTAINGQAPLDVSPHKREGHSQEEPVKPADDNPRISAHASTPNDSTSQKETLQEIPTKGALLPAVPGTPTKTPPPTKTDGKGKSKIPEAVPLCSPRTIREAIDALRGYSLEEAGAIIHQNKVLKEWCQKHTLEDYQRVIEHVTKGYCANKEHQFWREGTNFSSFFNADKLAKLTPGILACTGHIPKPNAPPEVASKEEPKIIGWQPQRRVTPPKGVTVIYAQG